jgi:hypothetical protein
MKKVLYAVWGAAALFIVVFCSWQEFSEMLDYLLPAVSSAADAGYWWVQVPALGFLGGIVCFGVVATGYNLLSRILD